MVAFLTGFCTVLVVVLACYVVGTITHSVLIKLNRLDWVYPNSAIGNSNTALGFYVCMIGVAAVGGLYYLGKLVLALL
jgi:hypothetical protein